MRLLAAALLLSACAFSSPEPFFHARDGALPIADGARFAWVEEGSEARSITFRRRGRTYDVIGFGDERPMEGALFVAIPETREEDYVVQVRLMPDETAAVYAFVWRTDDGFRLMTNVRAFSDPPPQQAFDELCQMKQYYECEFRSRGDLLRFYRAHVHPAFVRAGTQTPVRYAELRPENAAAKRRMRRRF
jgi:hypothetical protein